MGRNKTVYFGNDKQERNKVYYERHKEQNKTYYKYRNQLATFLLNEFKNGNVILQPQAQEEVNNIVNEWIEFGEYKKLKKKFE